MFKNVASVAPYSTVADEADGASGNGKLAGKLRAVPAIGASLDFGHLVWSQVPVNRRRQGFFNAPSSIEAAGNDRERRLKLLRPFCEAQGFAIVRQSMIGGLVSRLFLRRCPSAVARLVISIVVAAFNGMKWRRTRPHVSQELCESGLTATPLSADLDSSASIAEISVRRWAIAAASHLSPVGILRRWILHCSIVVGGHRVP